MKPRRADVPLLDLAPALTYAWRTWPVATCRRCGTSSHHMAPRTAHELVEMRLELAKFLVAHAECAEIEAAAVAERADAVLGWLRGALERTGRRHLAAVLEV